MSPQQELQSELDRLGIRARAVVVPTDWDIGPVACFLFPDEPVTFIDSAIDTPRGREVITDALSKEGLRPKDVERILITHMHSDHFGGAKWLQDESGCEVFVHEADLALLGFVNEKEAARALLVPLGFDDEVIRKLTEHEHVWRPPTFTAFGSRLRFESANTALRVEHHPGHSPGHVWITDEPTQAIFVGDYLLANMPTNAGMEVDPDQPTRRIPLLALYNDGLDELKSRDAPVLFPAHGPPITDHASLIDRRLTKSERRTRHVLEGLRKAPPSTALAVGRRLWGTRVEKSWEVLADLVGRLDLLVARGEAEARMEEDGAWYFRATK